MNNIIFKYTEYSQSKIWKSVGKEMEKFELVCIVGGVQDGVAPLENSFVVIQKLHIV